MALVDHSTGDGSVSVTWRMSASPMQVWQHLTDVRRLHEWLGEPVQGDFSVGGEQVVVDHGGGYLCRSTVEVAVTAQTLSMTWNFPDEPASRMSINLIPVSGEAKAPEFTDLLLEHTQLAGLTASYLPGWITHLTYLEASLAGQPIPTDAFWRLYETHRHLVDERRVDLAHQWASTRAVRA